jgi:hypothetical protein
MSAQPNPEELFDDDFERPEIGCYECDGGWKHGCCSDMCIGCYEAVECDRAYPCRLCNSSGGFIV